MPIVKIEYEDKENTEINVTENMADLIEDYISAMFEEQTYLDEEIIVDLDQSNVNRIIEEDDSLEIDIEETKCSFDKFKEKKKYKEEKE
jgi:hypothetical protein